MYSDIKELLNDAKNIASGANDLQLKSLLLDIQQELMELFDENRNLREKIIELEKDNTLESNLEFHGNVYYNVSNKRFYCTSCWDSDKVLSSAIDVTPTKHLYKGFWCERCKRPKSTKIPNDTQLDL